MSALLLQALGVVCPSCDFLNPPASQRCSDCATPLTAPAPAPAHAPPAARPLKAAHPPTAASSPAPSATPLHPPMAAPRAPALPPEPHTDTAFPPGMRPAARPRPAAVPSPVAPLPLEPARPPAAAPVSAPPRPAGPAPSRYGLSVQSGHGAGHRYRLGGAGCMVGRSKGAILFPDDVFVSPHHGTFLLREGRLYVRDEGSASGVYVTLSGGYEVIPTGAYFAAGQRLFRFAGALPRPQPVPPGHPASYGAPVPQAQTLYGLEEIIVGGRAGRAVVTGGPLLTIGQQHCDLAYPGDESLAGRHCELSPSPQGATLRDLSGGLGTFVRLSPGVERALNPGDRVRIGLQVLQVEAVG